MFYGKDCQCYGREPNQESIMKAWEHYLIEDAIVVIAKAVKAIKSKTINSCWRKLCPDVVHDFTGFTTEPAKENMNEIVNMTKKVGDERFQDRNLREIQQLMGATPEGLTQDDLIGMRAF